MRYGAIFGGLLGMGLALTLMAHVGFASILTLLLRTGATGFLILLLVHLIQTTCSALAWREIAERREPRIRFATFFELRWIREAVNNLLPLAQVGGELIATRLLRRQGVSLSAALAGTTADLSLEVASQILFTLLGVLLLLRNVVASGLVQSILIGVTVATVGLACGGATMYLGGAQIVERAILWLAQRLQWNVAGEAQGLTAALFACYRSRSNVIVSISWHMASWLMGGIEVCLALHFLGFDVGLGEGLAIESVGQALKAAGFAIPGAVGIQEGGYVIACRIFGLSSELALALSLLKRCRELVLGIPGLVVWYRLERKPPSVNIASLPAAAP